MDYTDPADCEFLYYHSDAILLRQQHSVTQCRFLTSNFKYYSTIASARVILYVHQKQLLAASFPLRKQTTHLARISEITKSLLRHYDHPDPAAFIYLSMCAPNFSEYGPQRFWMPNPVSKRTEKPEGITSWTRIRVSYVHQWKQEQSARTESK